MRPRRFPLMMRTSLITPQMEKPMALLASSSSLHETLGPCISVSSAAITELAASTHTKTTQSLTRGADAE
jgi:hypothetical protein